MKEIRPDDVRTSVRKSLSRLGVDGVVAIPKVTGRDHLAANFEVVDFSLSEAEMDQIRDLRSGLGMRVKNVLPSIMRSLPFTPPA